MTPSDSEASIRTERLPEAIYDRDVWRARIESGTTDAGAPVDVDLTVTVDLEPL